MKIKCNYTVDKEVEAEVDDKFAEILETPYNSKLESLLIEAVYDVIIASGEKDLSGYGIRIKEIFQADTRNCMYED